MGGALISAAAPGQFFIWYNATPLTRLLWCIVAFTALDAHLYFPRPAFSDRQRKVIIHLSAVLALLFILVTVLDSLILRTYLLNNSLYLVVFLSSLAIGIGLLFYNFGRKDWPAARRQTGIILTASLLGLLPFIVMTFIPVLLLRPDSLVSGQFSVLFFAFIPLAYGYVIFQNQLLKIDLAINHTPVFFFMAFTILLDSF